MLYKYFPSRRYLRIFYMLALFLVLSSFVSLIAGTDSSFETEWTDGGSEVPSALDSDIDNIIVKVSPNKHAESLHKLDKFPLQDLHFNTNQGYYVTLTEMTGELARDVAVTRTATSLRERRTRLTLLISLIKIEGHTLVETDTYEVSAYFSLTLTNITGKGLATLDIHASTPVVRISKVMLDYEYGHSHLDIIPNRDKTKIPKILREKYFKGIVVKKIWRDLSFQLNSAVKRTLTQRFESYVPPTNFEGSGGMMGRLELEEVNNVQSANDLVDKVIKASRGILVDRYQDEIPIPDIEQYFGRTVLYILPLRGHFLANEGTARGLSTAFRQGDTSYSTENRTTHFYGPISFSDLNLYYEHYDAKFIGIGPTGTINTKLRPITVQVHLRIDWRSRNIFLDQFKVEHLGDLEVQITGVHVFNWLFSRITTWVVGWVRDTVVDKLETKYQNYITEILSGVNVDDVISGKAFPKN